MVKCDLTHNIIVFLKRAKVNSFKEFFSKNQKAFNSEIKTSTSLMTNRCFQNYMINFLSCLYKQIPKRSLQEQLPQTLYFFVIHNIYTKVNIYNFINWFKIILSCLYNELIKSTYF